MNLYLCAAFIAVIVGPGDPGETTKTNRKFDRSNKNLVRSIASMEAAFEKLRFSRFIDQMVRANQLAIVANRLEGWVYAYGFEEIIEEFEAARNSIELAEQYLRRDFESQGSLSASASLSYRNNFIESASYELDRAEYSIQLLVAISLSEY